MRTEPCPDLEQLRLLLETVLLTDQEAQLAGHLDRCSRCREAVDAPAGPRSRAAPPPRPARRGPARRHGRPPPAAAPRSTPAVWSRRPRAGAARPASGA